MKPVDPFELADRLLELVTEKQKEPKNEKSACEDQGHLQRDDREFLAEQVVELGGECPWDGQPFNADAMRSLVESLREAERLGRSSSGRWSGSRR